MEVEKQDVINKLRPSLQFLHILLDMPRSYNRNYEMERWYDHLDELEREYNNNYEAPIYASPGSRSKSSSRSSRSSLRGLPSRRLPKNAVNTITGEDIENGNSMANFHGEFELSDRYYKKRTVNRIMRDRNPKNPYNREPLNQDNITYYKAKIPKTKRRTRPIRLRKKGTRRIKAL